MAKAQFAIDGKIGKDWKVTSFMGYRIHPVKKIKKHHNGTDIWSSHEPCWIEAPYDGKVVKVGHNPAGFGNSVTLLHKIDGQYYTSVYAHMQDNSIKVKEGQTIEAGTPLGKMGTTGMSTGKHLHWELQLGKKYVWNDTGKNFIEPVGFFKAQIAKEAALVAGKAETPADAPVAPAPVHNEEQAAAVEANRQAEKAAKARPQLKVGSKGDDVKYLQEKLGITADGIFGPNTEKAVNDFKRKHNLEANGVVGAGTWKAIG